MTLFTSDKLLMQSIKNGLIIGIDFLGLDKDRFSFEDIFYSNNNELFNL